MTFKKHPHPPAAEDAPAVPVVPPLPAEGGSYTRHPKTGELTPNLLQVEPTLDAAGRLTPIPTTPQPTPAAPAVPVASALPDEGRTQ